jgi:flagellar protein FliS
MATNAYDAYLESKILTADPVELVEILLRAALDAIRKAQEELRRGRIQERSRAITRASEVLNELALSVNHEAGGELSRNLVELYAYVQQLLIEANARQREAPLQEAERLVASLAEAWQSCRASSVPARVGEPEAAAGYTPLSCTC